MNLYLPLEIFNREFQSKLLIAMESASRGMNVYMGRLNEYLSRDFFAPGIVLQKSITPTPHRLKELEFLKKKNFIVTSLDEEVGLVNSNSQYVNLRYSNQSLALTDRVFTWGKFDYDNLSKKYKKHKNKFVKSGNPRLDFWKKNFEFFFKKKKHSYENYILFSLNIALWSSKEFNDYIKFIKAAKYHKRGLTVSKLKKINKDSFKMFEEFSNLITNLSKKTNSIIIVRPHPIGKDKDYNSLKKLSNVKVVREGSISDWIYNAKVVIHSGCTGGLESSIRGRPTISYNPIKSSVGHQFTNKFSKKTKNLNDCLTSIDKILKRKKNISRINTNDFKFRAFNFSSKKPAYKSIVDEFIKLTKIKKIENQNNDLLLKFKFKVRDVRSKVLKLKYGNIKFSFFDTNETLNTFKILTKLNPKFNDLKLNFIKKDIIQIKKND